MSGHGATPGGGGSGGGPTEAGPARGGTDDGAARVSVDLHTHTRHSPDSVTSPGRLVERARAAGLDRVAVTDHDAIEGALRARELAPETVIVGQEISCRGRVELIGLFLEAWIPSGLPAGEAADRIREQGGVVYAPHPFAYLVDRDRRGRGLVEVADVVEAVNARAFWPGWNRRADESAGRRELPRAAGSDAHFPSEVGRAFVRMPAFRTAGEFLAAVPDAEPVLRRGTSPVYHVSSAAVRALRYLVPGMKGSKGPRPSVEEERREGRGPGVPGRAAADEVAGGTASPARGRRRASQAGAGSASASQAGASQAGVGSAGASQAGAG